MSAEDPAVTPDAQANSQLLHCPSCAQALRVPKKLLGKRGRCRACGETFLLAVDQPPKPPKPATPAKARVAPARRARPTSAPAGRRRAQPAVTGEMAARRDVPRAVGYAIGAVALCFLCVKAAGWAKAPPPHGIGWLGWTLCVVAGVLAAGCGLMALRVKKAPCPHCGRGLPHIANPRPELCTHCGDYVVAEVNFFRSPADDLVLKSPYFTAVLPESITIPQVCSVCGGEATHTVEVASVPQAGQAEENALATAAGVAAAMTLGVGFVQSGGNTDFLRIPVPHCDKHNNGVALGQAETCHFIRFRSYRYFREYCRRNEVRGVLLK